MEWKKTVITAMLSATVVLSFMPAEVLAEKVPATDVPGVIIQEEGSVSVDSFDSDEFLMQYIDRKVAEETGSDSGNRLSVEAVHKRRAMLDAVAGNMYDVLAPSVREVAAGERENTAFVVPASAIFNSAKYDAETLGVDHVVEDGKITAEAFDAFVSKLYSDLTSPLSDMMGAMIADMPYELYWLDNEAGINFVFNNDWFRNNMYIYPDSEGNTCIGIETADTEKGTLEMTFSFYVSQDYSKGGSPTQYGPKKTTEVNTSLTKAAANTANNISGIIRSAKDKYDDEKLYQYKDDICRLASYHPTAMRDPDFPYGDPWQLIYVFDGDPGTKVVCEGYSKAFQYLCDNTSFTDSNVESRLVSGQMGGNTRGRVISGAHMWNIVHMSDGKNYIADITNCDDETMAADDPSGYPDEVFLKGAVYGSVREGYTFNYDDGKLYYKYEPKILRLFTEEELTLSDLDYPYGRGEGENIDWDTASIIYKAVVEAKDSEKATGQGKGKAASGKKASGGSSGKGADTGDNNDLPVWITIHLSALSLAAVYAVRKRRKRKLQQ